MKTISNRSEPISIDSGGYNQFTDRKSMWKKHKADEPQKVKRGMECQDRKTKWKIAHIWTLEPAGNIFFDYWTRRKKYRRIYLYTYIYIVSEHEGTQKWWQKWHIKSNRIEWTEGKCVFHQSMHNRTQNQIMWWNQNDQCYVWYTLYLIK